MEYEKALLLAEQTMALLQPGCKLIEIAGSIRRKKADPNDIDIIRLPSLPDHPGCNPGIPGKGR
jgi:DNA polymerase/3'-5' exonuclease PolX